MVIYGDIYRSKAAIADEAIADEGHYTRNSWKNVGQKNRCSREKINRLNCLCLKRMLNLLRIGTGQTQ